MSGHARPRFDRPQPARRGAGRSRVVEPMACVCARRSHCGCPTMTGRPSQRSPAVASRLLSASANCGRRWEDDAENRASPPRSRFMQRAFCRTSLAAGETGTVSSWRSTPRRRRPCFNMRSGSSGPAILRLEVASTTAHEISLHNGAVISVHANTYRTMRGKTLLAASSTRWRSGETTLLVARRRDVSRRAAQLRHYQGMLIGISCPYRKIGLLFQKFRDSFAQGDPDVLVVQGASRLFNPTLDQSVIAAAFASDPEAARAEWDAEFRSDISSSWTTNDRSGDRLPRSIELPPLPRTVSGFRRPERRPSQGFAIRSVTRTAAISSRVIRGRKPPFDPQSVVRNTPICPAIPHHDSYRR